MRRRWLLVLGVLLLGCENPPEQYDPEPNVYCMVRSDETRVRALAGRSVAFTDTVADPYQWQGVAGCRVTVNGTVLTGVPDSTGVYRAESLAVRPGQVCSLEVEYPDGRLVSGRALVPGSFAFDSVRVDTVVRSPEPYPDSALRVRAAWPQSVGAGGYFYIERATYRFPWGDTTLPGFDRWTAARADSSAFPLRVNYGTFDAVLTGIRIQVLAADTNYADYAGRPPWEDPVHRLTGGLGVFGAACVVTRDIALTP